MKTIYIARSANDNTDCTSAFFDKAQATRKAVYLFEMLTAKERKTDTVSLETWNLDIDGDGLTAVEVWQNACDEELTDRDPDGYEQVDNVFIAVYKNKETPFTPKSKVFHLNGHTIEVYSCLYLYGDDPVQEGIFVHDMNDEHSDGDAIYGNGNIIDNIDDADDLKDIIEYEAAETRFEKLADGLYKVL